MNTKTLWGADFKLVLEICIDTIQNNDSGITGKHLLENSYKILDGTVESKLFQDVLLTSCVGDSSKLFLVALEKFCSEVNVLRFTQLARKTLLLCDLSSTSAVIFHIRRLLSLVIHAYNMGYLEGVGKNTVYFSTGASPWYLVARMIIKGEERGYSLKFGGKDRVKLSAKKLNRVKKYLSGKTLGFDFDLTNVSPKIFSESLNNLLDSAVFSYTDSLFVEKESGVAMSNLVYAHSSWGRESYPFLESQTMLMFFALFSSEKAESDLLHHRKIYVPEKGVTIKFKKSPEDSLSHITLREYHNSSEHLLLINYFLKDGASRFIWVNIENCKKVTHHILYEIDATVLTLIFSWLGVLDRIDTSTLAEQTDSSGEVKEALNGFIEFAKQATREDNLIFETPRQWNYDTYGNYTGKNKKDSVYAYKEVQLEPYSRKLPIGQKASKKAIDFAKSICMDLESGMTIVEGFERSQRIKL